MQSLLQARRTLEKERGKRKVFSERLPLGASHTPREERRYGFCVLSAIDSRHDLATKPRGCDREAS
jgi:hypothetical protein